jgi:hypothetical protein
MPDDPNQPPEPSLLERAENWTAQMSDEHRATLSGPDRDSYDTKVGMTKGIYGFTKSTISGLIDIATFVVNVFHGDPATQQKIGDDTIWFVKGAWINYFGTAQQQLAQNKAISDWCERAFNAAKDKITKDWDQAKKDGKEQELISEWGTRGILEVASLFVGVGEVKGAEAASDLAKVGNVVDKAKVLCPMEEAAMAERLAAAEKAVALAKAAKRAQAIEDSGMVAEHAEAISKVAQERKEVIIFQNTNKEARARLAEGAAPKPVTMHGKSAKTGPAKGYVPRDQSLSKAAPEKVKGLQEEVEAALHSKPPKAKIYTLPDGTEVLADPVTGKPYTSDYDLLAIGREGETGLPFATENQGVIAPEDEGTMNDINDAVDHPGGDVVQHGAAGNAPVTQDINYPVTAMDPNGDIVNIEGPQQLQDYLSAKQAEGYNFNLDPAWGLQ